MRDLIVPLVDEAVAAILAPKMNFRNILMGGIVIAIVIMLMAAFILPAIEDITIDAFAENFSSTTGVAETDDDITLGQSHHYDTTEGMSVSSDNTNDTPAILSYNDTTEVVNVGGLNASDTRILTITYQTESANANQFIGFSELAWLLPTILLVGVVWKLIQTFT